MSDTDLPPPQNIHPPINTIMTSHDIILRVEELSPDELSEAEKSLCEAARRATYRSYSPYSHFSVGAAILLNNGTIIGGANQENAAYPSGMCAERTAAYYAGAQYPGIPFLMIAIAARDTDGQPLETPVTPCGACRQALLEYEKRSGIPIRLLLAGAKKVYRLPSVASTLPLAFDDF